MIDGGGLQMVEITSFARAMSTFPSGVVIATTVDSGGKAWGFTASSFSSVSLRPPLVLVCLAKTAECHSTFRAAPRFSVNILGAKDQALAKRFATRGAPKFVGDEFVAGPHGLPLVRTAVAALVCKKFADYDCGDHSVIVGEVDNINAAATGEAMVYYRQKFRDLALSVAGGENQP